MIRDFLATRIRILKEQNITQNLRKSYLDFLKEDFFFLKQCCMTILYSYIIWPASKNLVWTLKGKNYNNKNLQFFIEVFFRALFQADSEGPRYNGGADYHRRFHVPVLWNSQSSQRRPEGRHTHRQEGGGPGHRTRPVADQCGRRRHLHGQPGQWRQEDTERNRRYCRSVILLFINWQN